jgi:hypothetical protein
MTQRSDLDQELREMLRDVPPHDDWARRTTLEAIPSIPQRRWPRLSLPWGGSSKPRRASTLGALTAALLGVAVVGLLLSVDPAPSPAPGSAAPVSAFNGLLLCGDTEDPFGSRATRQLGSTDDPYSVSESRGSGWVLEMAEVSDPRFDGVVIDYWDQDDFMDVPNRYTLGAGTWRVETEVGAWQGSFHNLQLPGDDWATTTFPMYGESAYEGLVAMWELDYLPDAMAGRCGWAIEGLVLETDLVPPPPEPASTPAMTRTPSP